MIKLTDVSKSYLIHGKEELALSKLNLDINKGDLIDITCCNSLEKRAITNLLGLLEVPDSGNIKYFDTNIESKSLSILPELRKNKVGFAFYRFSLIDELTVFENVALSLIYRNGLIRNKKEKVFRALEFCRLSKHAKKFPTKLDAFSQKNVVLARTLVNKPKVILTDFVKPGSTDSQFLELFFRLNKLGTTVISISESQDGLDTMKVTSINKQVNNVKS
ncbi:MAG: hypothetical protein CL840_21720 [Crocinitomicaceae bacterium]|nr:hypothetical protein [Crocinitomicaceae bacterium]|tara:strand:- start:937 stop:1593 length:657 start_codon:yes stop_codon:yes gene_type:complete